MALAAPISAVAPDSVGCKAKLGGRPVKAKANCTWQLAKSARGKRLVVSVTVGYQSTSYTQSFPLKVT